MRPKFVENLIFFAELSNGLPCRSESYDIRSIDFKEGISTIQLIRQMRENGTANGLNGTHGADAEQRESFEGLISGK